MYGFDAAHRSSPAGALVFRVSRDRIDVKVHQPRQREDLELDVIDVLRA